MKTKGIVRWSATDKPDTKFDPHKWYIELSIGKEDARILKDVGIRVKTIVDEQTEEITYTFRATRNVDKRKGRVIIGTNPKPVVVDSALNPFQGIIGRGSEVIVVHKPWEWRNGKGWSTDLRKIQILKLVPYAGSVVETEEDKLEILGDGIDKSSLRYSESMDYGDDDDLEAIGETVVKEKKEDKKKVKEVKEDKGEEAGDTDKEELEW